MKMKLHLYVTEAEKMAYRRGFQVGTLAAEEHQTGTVGSKERLAFWEGVYDRAQYEIGKV